MYIVYSEDKLFKDIGTTRQLFIDDDVIASVMNVTRRQHTPRKHPDNPLIKHDKPWEVIPYIRNGDFDVCMDPADGLFKCWYTDFYDFFGSDRRKRRLKKRGTRTATPNPRTASSGTTRRWASISSMATTPTRCFAIRLTSLSSAPRSYWTSMTPTRLAGTRCRTCSDRLAPFLQMGHPAATTRTVSA